VKKRVGDADDVDNRPELIVDREFESPKPLDRRIASVWLRTPTNNPTDGYDLLLSASFGKERVILRAGEFEIDVDFSVKTADIELQFVRCTHDVINTDQGGRIEEGRTTVSQRLGVEMKTTGNFGAVGSVSADGALRAEGRAGLTHEKALTSASMTERSVTRYDWRLLDDDQGGADRQDARRRDYDGFPRLAG
jgi:hypothetical protein